MVDIIIITCTCMLLVHWLGFELIEYSKPETFTLCNCGLLIHMVSER